MLTLHTACEKDRHVFYTARDYNIKLLVGSAHVADMNRVTSLLNTKLGSVIIRGQNETGSRITTSSPGVCTYNPNSGTSEIEMYGFKGLTKSKENFTKHEFAHELWHSLINVTNHETLSTKPKTSFATVDAQGNVVIKYPSAGTISNIDFDQKREEKRYGLMFMETTTDLLTASTYAAFDEETRKKGITIDKIFNDSYKSWHNNAMSGYSLFTSLTRLLISAYSNVGGDYLDNVARQGHSIFDCKAKTRTGKTIIANSYLYNYAHNPLEIEREFDKYMGLGTFEKLATKMDQAFDGVLNQGQSILNYRATIKEFMIVVSNFANAKKAHYIRDGLISRLDAEQQVSKYNRIWNSLQREYSTYFSSSDIEDIYRQAQAYNFQCRIK